MLHINKDEVSYPVASSKEVEDELISILKDINEIRKENEWELPQFVFVIDELDKIEPHNNTTIEERESSNPSMDYSVTTSDRNRFRQRQEVVATLLANLKGFLNVVMAKFFFIGGREMFDADLADIADRDSFYSSIFNDVIYIESFFKDSTSSTKGGVTQMTENYLCNIILNQLKIDKDEKKKKISDVDEDDFAKTNLKRLFKKLKINNNLKELTEEGKQISLTFCEDGRKCTKYGYDEKTEKIKKTAFSEEREKLTLNNDEIKQQAYKAIFTLQNYIIYLAYRSNGTPKKLTALIEKLIVNVPKYKKGESNYEFLRDNVVVLHDKGEDPLTADLSDRLFLKFGFNTQYEIGLTSNLYRPYIIANSRHLKSLGDKLLYSSSFIIDHIFKFHPFGFSWRNLELIPEVVLVNREPNLRNFIEDLMRFYSLTYIRDTVSGIFDYRFGSIIKRELIFLSKISDLSSAAFNFTLDESLSTKRHYKKKLIEMREKYKRYTPTSGDNLFVHSLCFIQTILGDLHFYDKEYDEAVIYYTESIQPLRFPVAIAEGVMTRHQFLLWLRNQLKLGLTLEKMRAYDSALSLYRTLILDTEIYLEKIVNRNKKSNCFSSRVNSRNVEQAEDHRTIHLISMSFVAFLAAIEKERTDGITYANLYRNREDFKRIIALSSETDIEKRKVDRYRRNFLQADYYNNVGSILFYKNCQFSKYFEDEKYWLESFMEFGGNNLIAFQQQDIYNKTTLRDCDYFPSLVSFNYYWNSLYFLLEYHRKGIVGFIDKRLEIDTVVDEVSSVIGIVNNEPVLRIVNSERVLPLDKNLLAICTGYLLPECVDMIGSKRFYYIANVVSKIGDSILAGLKKENFKIPKNSFSALNVINQQVKQDGTREDNLLDLIKKFQDLGGNSLYKIETVLYIYKLAAALYRRAGQISYYTSQLKRILYIIKDLIEINKGDKKNLENLETFLGIDQSATQYDRIEEIAVAIFKATTINNEVSNRPQILKYREIFDITEDRERDRELIYNNINNVSDNREVVILVEGIKMKLGKKFDLDSYIEKFKLSKSIISSYGTMNNRYLRMLELKYRGERCYFIMKKILLVESMLTENLEFKIDLNDKGKSEINLKEIKKHLINILQLEKGSELSMNDIVTFLIQEGLFCFRELIKMYDPGYVIGYSFIAEAHNRMGDWCHAYDNYQNILRRGIYKDVTDDDIQTVKKSIEKYLSASKKEEVKVFDKITILSDEMKNKESKNCLENLKIFRREIKEFLGADSLAYLESKNHYESAIQYYYKVIQLHSDGKTYRDKLHNLYMLEDDYNDNTTHYIIASERIRVNTGNIREKINELIGKTKDSKVYEYSSYLTSEGDSGKVETDSNVIKDYIDFFNQKI